jgi:hypothetical protein
MLCLVRGDIQDLNGKAVIFSKLKGYGCNSCPECLDHDSDNLVKILCTPDRYFYNMIAGAENVESQAEAYAFNSGRNMDEIITAYKDPSYGQVDVDYYWHRIRQPMKDIAKWDVDLVYAERYTCAQRCMRGVMSQMEEYINIVNEQLDSVRRKVKPASFNPRWVPRAWRN